MVICLNHVISKSETLKFLSDVPEGKEFRFCLPNGVNTMVLASSLDDFGDKLDGVDSEALLFHYPRGDFQKWIKEVIGDSELADRLCFIERDISGESLRKALLKIVHNRIKQLKAIK